VTGVALIRGDLLPAAESSWRRENVEMFEKLNYSYCKAIAGSETRLI